MLLTQKLLGYLGSVFDKDARSFLAFTVRHESGAFAWEVSDRVMRGTNGADLVFSVHLEAHTIRTLLSYLAAVPGITVSTMASSDQLGISACALIDGAGVQAKSNGDHVYAFTSIAWAYMDALSVELTEARRQIKQALQQMSIKSASLEWLDEWGGYFAVGRNPGESDAAYGNRIIAEVLRPRGNNKAIELALLDRFGQQSEVIDLQRFGDVIPAYNGLITHNSDEQYNAVAAPYYGLFKIVIGYDLLGGSDVSGYVEEVKAFVELLRDAGTHLESVELGGSMLSDVVDSPPTDGPAIQQLGADVTMADALTAPGEYFPSAISRIGSPPASPANPNPDAFADTVADGFDTVAGLVAYDVTYSGLRSYNGAVPHAGGTSAPM